MKYIVTQIDGYEQDKWEAGVFGTRDTARDFILTRIKEYMTEYDYYIVDETNPWRIMNKNDANDFHEWSIE